MRKFKKALVLSLACAMGLSLVACGGNDDATTEAKKDDTTTEAAKDDASDATSEAEVSGSDEGKVLNIYAWNEEFKSRITDHYPGYEEVDATHGKIGDVDVVWTITPNNDNAYQNNLDQQLLKQADASADDKIDIFLVEADYALKYSDTDYTMAVSDLGITDDELANQYDYTKKILEDSNGVLKGVSWQSTPGVLIYNREIAKDMWGSDDPAEVQKHVSDWDTFYATGSELAAKVTSSQQQLMTHTVYIQTTYQASGLRMASSTSIHSSRLGQMQRRHHTKLDRQQLVTFGAMSGQQDSIQTVRYSHTSDQLG